MKTVHVILLTAFAGAVAAVVPAKGQEERTTPPPPGGMLKTMPHGNYDCAFPGDAGAEAYRVDEAENFRISTASRYTNSEGAGTYILRGNDLTFTRGPKKGERFVRVGDNQLRKLDNAGERTRLLCTRRLGDR
ncbi:MAG: elongation factor P [Erythrobacter sp.]